MDLIKAGVGEAPIRFNKELFPTPGEGYTGVHDDIVAHAICFEQGAAEKYVFLGLNLVGYQDCESLKNLAHEITGAKAEHVLVHCNHNLASPHGAMGTKSAETERYDSFYKTAVSEAVSEALKQAEAHMEPADISFYTAVSKVNVSRIITLEEGMWQGTNEAGGSDHTVPVIKIDRSSDGRCMAILYAVNMAPGVLEGSRLENGDRLISGDIAGACEKYLQRVFPGAVCCYCLGASGDQWQALRAVTDTVNAEGKLITEDLHETGFVYADALGRKLASAITMAVSKGARKEQGMISMETRDFIYAGQKELGRDFHLMHPGKVEFEPDEDVHSDTTVFMLGDIAVIAAHAEINVGTLAAIRAQTKCKKIFFMAFTNGAGGYMTEKEVYDGGGYQCRKSRFARGSAELFAENIVSFLEEIKGGN